MTVNSTPKWGWMLLPRLLGSDEGPYDIHQTAAQKAVNPVEACGLFLFAKQMSPFFTRLLKHTLHTFLTLRSSVWKFLWGFPVATSKG